MDPIGELAGEPEGESIDHQKEEPQGKDGDRKGQEGQDRPYDGVNNRQNDTKHNSVKIILYNEPWKKMGTDQDDNRSDDHTDDKEDHLRFSKAILIKLPAKIESLSCWVRF